MRWSGFCARLSFGEEFEDFLTNSFQDEKRHKRRERERDTHTHEKKRALKMSREKGTIRTSYSNIYIYTYQNEIHTLRGLQRRTTIGGLKNR